MRNELRKICTDISDACWQAIKEDLFSSCCVGISKNGKTEILTFDCKEDSIFDCASITKSMPTGYLALKAIENNLLTLETPVAEILPDFAKYHNSDAKIFHLLTHSLDYRFPMSSLKDLAPQEIWQRISSHKFEIPPGQLFCYGNANSILLGRVLEGVYKTPLAKLAKAKVFEPLEMKDTGWKPLEWANPNRIIPTEICSWRGRELKGETHDESAWKLEQKFGAVGSAGVFSTVPDILKFLHSILKDDFLIEKLTKNAFEHGECTALGFELNNEKFMGKIKEGNAVFGKTGFTGTSFICCPQSKSCLVILSNYTYPKRKPNADRINEFRAKLAEKSTLPAMFFSEDYKWMAQAIKLAEEAALNGEVPIGAVIVLNGKQIATGQNRMEELCSATAHAEILAINEAGEHLKNWRLDGAILYVSLEPCQMCWGAIKNSRISRVVFAAKDTRNITGITKYECQVENGLLERESAEILQKFFRDVRRLKGDSGAKTAII